MIELNKLVGISLLSILTGCGKSAQHNMGKADDIAWEAKSNEGSTKWSQDAEAYQRGNKKYFERGSWKCNLFVHDMLYDAGN